MTMTVNVGCYTKASNDPNDLTTPEPTPTQPPDTATQPTLLAAAPLLVARSLVLAALFTTRIRLRSWRRCSQLGFGCAPGGSCRGGCLVAGGNREARDYLVLATCQRPVSGPGTHESAHPMSSPGTRHPAPGTRADEFEATYRGTTGADAATAAKYGASAASYAEPVQAPPLGQHSRRRRSPDRQRPRRSP